MPYSYKLFTSFSELEKQFHIVKEGTCYSAIVNEVSNLPDIQDYYLILLNDEEPASIFYFQLLSVKPYHFNIQDKKIQQFGLSWALRIVKPTLLVAGNLFRHDIHFHTFLDENVTKERKAEMYQLAIKYMIEQTNASGIFLKDVEEEIALFVMKDSSCNRMEDDISMEMPIHEQWKSFTDYELMLKHKYVQRLRKIRNSFAGMEVIEFDEQHIQEYANQIQALYMQVCSKQMVCMGILNEKFFIELKKSLKGRYKMFGFFHDKKLVAFSSAIIHNDAYDMNYIGFDYELNQPLNLYFNILFHCIEMAIAHQCNNLILGRTAIEAKAIMGCIPDYRYSFYKLRNPIVNWFFQMVSKYFQEQQGEKWKDRHPFKSMYYEEKK